MTMLLPAEQKTEDESVVMRQYMMFQEEHRLDSFQDWPFREGECNCTPQKLAAAGFYHIPSPQEPDAVRCFVCSKELDGWEPTDDPWKEHVSHSGQCPFLKYKNKKLTVEGLASLFHYRLINEVKKSYKASLDEFTSYAKEVNTLMKKL